MREESEVLVLTREEVASVLTMTDCIEVVEEGFRAYGSGKAVVPFPVALQVPENQGDIHIKPGYILGSSTYTVKIASGFYNKFTGTSPSHGMLLLFDSRTGAPVCFEVDRGLITDMRTAAAGAVAAKLLARKAVQRVGVVGTGVQARLQAQALAHVRSFEELVVWGRDRAKADRYVSDMEKLVKGRVLRAATAEEAVVGSDIVVTATMSTAPLVKASWVRKGTHITAVGSDSPEKQELEVGVLAKADKVVVDSLRQCALLGELHHALEEGAMAEADVHAELGEVLLGKRPGRERDDEITVCDLTGLAVQDVVTSDLVYRRALKKSIGSYIKV